MLSKNLSYVSRANFWGKSSFYYLLSENFSEFFAGFFSTGLSKKPSTCPDELSLELKLFLRPTLNFRTENGQLWTSKELGRIVKIPFYLKSGSSWAKSLVSLSFDVPRCFRTLGERFQDFWETVFGRVVKIAIYEPGGMFSVKKFLLKLLLFIIGFGYWEKSFSKVWPILFSRAIKNATFMSTRTLSRGNNFSGKETFL